jgi:hypothetical protein
MSSTIPIPRRDPKFRDDRANDETDDGYLMWIIAVFVGICLLVMIPAWRIAIAVSRLTRRRRIEPDAPPRPAPFSINHSRGAG